MPSNYFHICATETCSIYRIGITRLGVCHVLDGLVSVLIGAALMWMNQGTIWSGIGVWTGLPMMLAGVVCFMSRQRKHRGAISGVTVISIIAMGGSGFLFSSSAYNINKITTTINVTDHFPNYKFTETAPLVISNSFMMFFGLVEMVVCIWSASISMGMVCMCCPVGREKVFTIPYEGMENEEGPVGPDIIQTPIRQRYPNNTSAFMEELDDTGLPPFTDALPGIKAGGRQTKAPVLHIDMDLEWDEMTMPIEEDEIDQSIMARVGSDEDLNLRSAS